MREHPLPASGLNAELERAFEAMEASFHVHLISTFEPDLVWAPAEAPAGRWLGENRPDFDQFPVKDGERAVGVLLRSEGASAKDGTSVGAVMRPLEDGLIVSADMPIGHLIPELSDQHFRLVLRGSRVDGLVTQSDLLKLPVRMLIFGLISHLELCLRAIVRDSMPAREWLGRLKPSSRRAVEKRLEDLTRSRMEPDPLECTDLSDVVEILSDGSVLDGNFRQDAEAIRQLRNQVAHSKTFVSSPEDVQVFVLRFNSVRAWIERTSKRMEDN